MNIQNSTYICKQIILLDSLLKYLGQSCASRSAWPCKQRLQCGYATGLSWAGWALQAAGLSSISVASLTPTWIESRNRSNIFKHHKLRLCSSWPWAVAHCQWISRHAPLEENGFQAMLGEHLTTRSRLVGLQICCPSLSWFCGILAPVPPLQAAREDLNPRLKMTWCDNCTTVLAIHCIIPWRFTIRGNTANPYH